MTFHQRVALDQLNESFIMAVIESALRRWGVSRLLDLIANDLRRRADMIERSHDAVVPQAAELWHYAERIDECRVQCDARARKLPETHKAT